MEERIPIYKVEPKFNFIYELFMPTGKKIRNTLLALVLVVICYFFINIALNSSDINAEIIQKSNVNISSIFNNISIFLIGIITIKLVFHFVVQMWQYNSIKYTFYDDYLEYEDTFLNQHKKTLRYDNIKEIEIRRTIWDRMNGYGIIIIYSNAEKSANNGLILYSIKDPQKTYTTIDEIIHVKYAIKKENIMETLDVNPIEVSEDKENSFEKSLNNKE